MTTSRTTGIPPGFETAMEKVWRDRYDRLLFLARRTVDTAPVMLPAAVFPDTTDDSGGQRACAEYTVALLALCEWVYPPAPPPPPPPVEVPIRGEVT
jgi:hypothetical protein